METDKIVWKNEKGRKELVMKNDVLIFPPKVKRLFKAATALAGLFVFCFTLFWFVGGPNDTYSVGEKVVDETIDSLNEGQLVEPDSDTTLQTVFLEMEQVPTASFDDVAEFAETDLELLASKKNESPELGMGDMISGSVPVEGDRMLNYDEYEKQLNDVRKSGTETETTGLSEAKTNNNSHKRKNVTGSKKKHFIKKQKNDNKVNNPYNSNGAGGAHIRNNSANSNGGGGYKQKHKQYNQNSNGGGGVPNKFAGTLSVSSKYVIKDVPKHNVIKHYERYSLIRCCAQGVMQRELAYTDHNGMRKVKDRYCVALGSYYCTRIGTKFDLIMTDGRVIKCILGDQKADRHTDALHQRGMNGGSVAEFIVDVGRLPASARSAGSVHTIPEFRGEIYKIKVYKN